MDSRSCSVMQAREIVVISAIVAIMLVDRLADGHTDQGEVRPTIKESMQICDYLASAVLERLCVTSRLHIL